jgi:hypothetical protein
MFLNGLIKGQLKLPKELEMLSPGVLPCNDAQQVRDLVNSK